MAACRVAMDTSFIVPRCCPAPPTFLGTISQAHLLLMSLNVAKCNLGKVKFKTIPVSGRPTLRPRGDLFELSAGGASWFALHLLACLLACVKGHFARLFSSLFFPLHPPFGKYLVW